MRDRLDGLWREVEAHILQLEHRLILLEQGVLRLGQHSHERRFVQVRQGGKDGETADKFGNEAIFEEVLRLRYFEQIVRLIGVSRAGARTKSDPPMGRTLADDLIQADEGAPANEKNVGRIDADVILLGMF